MFPDQGGLGAGREGVGDCEGAVRQEVVADHGTRVQLCHLSRRSPQGQGVDLHA